MNWRDLFYFSSGERRALSFLLSLILIAFILLILNDHFTIESDEKIENLSSSDKEEIPEDSLIRQPVMEKPPTPLKKKITQTSPKKNFRKYPPPPFPKNEKLKAGEKVDLNRADTTLLKKVPGIGSAFARRIVGYRNLLGGFYSVEQLKEVYGMEEERFLQIEPFFLIDTSHIRQRKIDHLSPDSLLKHPYLNYPRQRAIARKLKQQGQISGWEEFILLEEFTSDDIEKLKNYFTFD